MPTGTPLPTPVMPSPARLHPVAEVAWVFLKLGTVAFGGPAAHVALMEEEVVRRRRWVTREEFLDLLGATHLIPGPNSTELAIHLGLRRAGWLGLVVAGVCFIIPAALLVTAIATAYVRFGSLPDARGLLAGVQPVILAIVAQAVLGLAKTAIKNRTLALAGTIAFVASAAGASELLILFGTALAVALTRRLDTGGTRAAPLAAIALPPPTTTPVLAAGSTAVLAAATASPGLWPILAIFLKIGSILFGSGYVLLAFLRTDLVESRGWITESQLIDAIAVGQFTPGPVFTTATFIGYLLARTPGAVVATIGIFLPGFILVALSGPLVPRLRRSPTAAAVLDGVNVASLALMAVVTFRLADTAIQGPWTAGLALLAAVILTCTKLNSAWLVLAGATLGYALPHLRP
ncbi:MAG: chromate efflux transporter [Verrucomicrobiales bacterium]|nr:chromate efflux transporter [Verrucomicrobiales bacterium]